MDNNFKKKCINLESLFEEMIAAQEKEDWSDLLQINKKIDVSLLAINIKNLSVDQKKQYEKVLKRLYESYQLISQQCGVAFKGTEDELKLLRKQQLAKNLYQQVQEV